MLAIYKVVQEDSYRWENQELGKVGGKKWRIVPVYLNKEVSNFIQEATQPKLFCKNILINIKHVRVSSGDKQ